MDGGGRTVIDRQRRDELVKQKISQKLVDSGEKERLKELLRQKLVDCGWRDAMKARCKGGSFFVLGAGWE